MPHSPEPSPQVVLLSMPFNNITHAPLALGCLAGALKREGIRVRTRHFGLDFAALAGGKYLSVLRVITYDLAGEWIFAEAAFRDKSPDSGRYLAAYAHPVAIEDMVEMRRQAADFIAAAAREIIALKPAIVGCSSMFAQNCSSLAILRSIREAAPEIVTAMGGANCEGEMGEEIHAAFPWVDHVFSGEADFAFPAFCRKILDGEPVGPAGWTCPGLRSPGDRALAKPGPIGRGMVEDLSALADPCYDDFLYDLEQSPFRYRIAPGYLMETSRGCWWGEKHQCSFCGLNGQSQKARRKDPDRAHAEILRLSARYNSTSFHFCDNLIPVEFFASLLPRLAEKKLSFLYEITPLFNRDRIRTLAAAGIRWAQPGIEYLHDGGLRELGKGNKACQNIRLLKWARQYGMVLMWNLLHDFPGEREEWLRSAIDLIPLLTHLQPPQIWLIPIRFDRFSKYFNNPEKYGLDLKPFAAYGDVYPLDDAGLRRIAYFFQNGDRMHFPEKETPLIKLLYRKLAEWHWLFPPECLAQSDKPPEKEAPPPMLGIRTLAGDALEIIDTRPCSIEPRAEIHGLEAEILLWCDAGLTLAQLKKRIAKPKGERRGGELREALDRLCGRRVLVQAGEHYVSLPLELPVAPYPVNEDSPGGRFLPPMPVVNLY
ncbi:MAG: RiPP maturation radical SAM C-methyltransferase [Planctomycetes bacterium]|nr:RiPP maturation radical SAM C-methyltransferase [Planctomycetota bacterium]